MDSPRDLIDREIVETKPRRKYEIDDAAVDGKSRIGFALGAIAVSAFVFMKEALFGSALADEEMGPSANHHADTTQELKPRKMDFSEDAAAYSQSNDKNESDLPEPPGSGTALSIFFGRAHSFELPGPSGRSDTSAAPFLVSDFPSAENDNFDNGAGSINPFLRTGTLNFDTGQSASSAGSASGPSASVNGDSVVVEGGDDDSTGPETSDDGNDDDSDDGTSPGGRVNRAPSVAGPITLDSLLINQSILIAASQLLLGATDPDGDDVFLLNLEASSGTLSLLYEDTWYYEPALNYVGDVSFTYQIGDGEFDTDQVALLEFLQVPGETIQGSEAADTIVGTPGNDVIDGNGGDDRILGNGGADLLEGDEGDDRIFGGDGDDTIYGGPGNDFILGGSGDDVIFGSGGDDTIFGEDGNDLIFGEPGDDFLNGGTGDDVVDGGQDNDELWGEAGNDLLNGGSGFDQIFGGSGDDFIIAGEDDDTADGGEGNDEFVAQEDDGDDIYNGSEGYDTYNLERTDAAATVDLANGTGESNDIGHDQLDQIEGVIGSRGADSISGDDFDNDLRGSDGNDVIFGANGEDELRGDDGDDFLDGGADDDELRGDDGNDILIGGLGSDEAEGDGGNDTFVALIGDGDDDYEGGDGIDTYDASQSTSGISVDLAAGIAVGFDTGLDQISGIENVIGGSGNDILMASEGVNVFYGGEGADTFVFRTFAEAGLGEGLRDRIEDFEIGDRIDLSFIDADNDEDGNQSFEFVLDTNAQSGTASLVMRFDFDDDGDEIIDTIIAGFVNDDQLPDFEICIAGQHNLSASDFIGAYVAA